MWGQLSTTPNYQLRQLSTTCSNVLKQPTGELLVAVNHNQLRTMASETVDPIDWSQPPPSRAVHPERRVHSINQCNLSGNRTCNRSMRGNHLAYEILPLRVEGLLLQERSARQGCHTRLFKSRSILFCVHLDILGVTFDSKLTFEKHLRSHLQVQLLKDLV